MTVSESSKAALRWAIRQAQLTGGSVSRARVVRARRGRLRDRDGQLQPGDRLDRLRHLGPAVLRAAHPGGRARGGARRAGERPGKGRDRAARRADPAGAGAGSGGRPGAGGGHLARGHPPGRGPRRLRPRAGESRADRAEIRHRDVHGGCGRDRQGDRLSGAGAALLRARRARHGDRLRRRHAAGA